MATDVCGSSNAARQFPTSRNHGSLSNLEASILMSRPQNQVSVQGNTSYLRHVEDLPSMIQPCPARYERLSTDPDLLVTPEKKINAKSRITSEEVTSRKSSLGSKSSGRDRLRSSQSVRFDDDVDVRYMSPEKVPEELEEELSEEDEVIIHDVLAPSLDKHMDNDGDYDIKVYKHHTYDTKTSKEDTHDTLKNTDDVFIESSQQTNTASTKNKVSNKIISKSSSNSKSTNLYSPREFTPDYTGLPSLQLPEHPLARPEFLSTLRVSEEMRQVEQAELDVAAAVENKLKTSSKTRERITEKVSAKVNVGLSSQFSELVSLDVRPAELTERKAKEIASRTRPTHARTKPEDQLSGAPDLMEFFSRALERETPSLTLRGLPSLEPTPQKADLHKAFDVYHHIRAWENG